MLAPNEWLMQSNDGSRRDVCGILLLDKSAGMTSNRALQRTKRLFRAAKAGHTGSLDPLATGMLPICLGKATKLSQVLLDAPKTYHVVSELGVATTTGDADGEIIARHTAPVPDLERIARVLARFTGTFDQIPPMYSALKHQGRRLYELARRGLEVERAPRRVTIHSIDLERYEWPQLVFTVSCSKGTYIRSLVTDIAVAAGTVGHVAALRRLSVAPFEGQPMRGLEALQAQAEQSGPESLDQWLLPPDAALREWPKIALDEAAAGRLGHGQPIRADAVGCLGRVRAYGPTGEFLGIAEVLPNGDLVPRKMF